MTRQEILNLPTEELFKLYIQRPCSPMVFKIVNQERHDVLNLYNSIKAVAGWR